MIDTDQQSPADKIRARFAAQAKTINQRTDLNEEGRDMRLARAFVQARTNMTKLKRTDINNLDQRRLELQQKHFGNPRSGDSTAIISYRDAMDRVYRLAKPDEALALLERAIVSGDDILGRVIASRAMGRMTLHELGDAWAHVLDRWLDGQPPATIADIEELADIEHGRNNMRTRFAMNVSYSLPTQPRLIGKNIERLAAEAEALPE